MYDKFHFTFSNLERQLRFALDNGYRFLTCQEYLLKKAAGIISNYSLVNRVDIDYSCKKAKRLAEIFNKIGVKATFFVRLHATEYNPFDFENYLCLRYIRDTGHEIGYHSEAIDQSVIWGESAGNCLKRDINLLNLMLEIEIKGVASHGGMTGLNNLDFWKNKKPSDFGLLYEAYEESDNFNLFQEAFYISDSEWTQWKCYNHGKLVDGDNRCLSEHVQNKHSLIYLLIHSDTYFDRHFYE